MYVDYNVDANKIKIGLVLAKVTYLVKYDFVILAETVLIDLVLTKSTGANHHAVLLTVPICWFLCVSHRSQCGGGGQ